MPHPSVNPAGSVKQVTGVLGAVNVKSTVLRDVDRLLRKAGTYVPNYQVTHPLRCSYKFSTVRRISNECLSILVNSKYAVNISRENTLSQNQSYTTNKLG